MLEVLLGQEAQLAIDQKWLWYAAAAAAVWYMLRSNGANPVLDQILGVLRGLLNWPASDGTGELEASGPEGIAARAAAAARLAAWLRKQGDTAGAKAIEGTIPKLSGGE